VNARRRVLLLGAAFVVIAACADTDQGVRSSRADEAVNEPAPPDTEPVDIGPIDTVPTDTSPVDTGTDTTPPESTPGTDVPATDPFEPPEDTTPPVDPGQQLIDFGDEKTPKSYDNFMNAAFIDITQFWAEEFPAIYDGAEFVPVSQIFAHYPDRSELPFLACVGDIGYEDAEYNAFYQFCFDDNFETDTTGDVIVYDDDCSSPSWRRSSETRRSASWPPTSTATRSAPVPASSTRTCRPSTPSNRRTASPVRGRHTSHAVRATCSRRSVTKRSRPASPR
jgi:hypothetical protein